jgi:hypothetical protein
MSNTTVWSIIKRAQELKAKTDADPSGGRHTDGTALYVALHEVNPQAALDIRDGNRDPYRKPENIDRFIAYMFEYFYAKNG